jgi:hypothetical protein
MPDTISPTVPLLSRTYCLTILRELAVHAIGDANVRASCLKLLEEVEV